MTSYQKQIYTFLQSTPIPGTELVLSMEMLDQLEMLFLGMDRTAVTRAKATNLVNQLNNVTYPALARAIKQGSGGRLIPPAAVLSALEGLTEVLGAMLVTLVLTQDGAGWGYDVTYDAVTVFRRPTGGLFAGLSLELALPRAHVGGAALAGVFLGGRPVAQLYLDGRPLVR